MMFRKPMRSVAVRRFATAITTLALSVSGLALSPAQANVPVNGDYSCATGVKDGPAPRYKIIDGEVSDGGSFAEGGGCNGTTVVFPYGITRFGIGAFAYARQLESLNIPATVTSIGWDAFRGADSLTSIVIPASVTSIERQAFFNVNKATTLTFAPGSNLQSIGSGAFEDMSALTSITIPASVTSIGDGAFGSTPSLTSITVDPGNQNYKTIDGVLFDKAVNTLITYPSKKSGGSYSIPAGVTNIGARAFNKSSSLTAITIPSGVTTIGNYAFGEAALLSSVNIPAGVQSIGEGAFTQTAITSINIPESVTSIGGLAFQYARELTSIKIPANVTSIGSDTFFGTNSLVSITFTPGSQLTSIGGRAFTSSAIRSITIPANVTSIGDQAFRDTGQLKTVKFEPGSKLATIGNNAFRESRALPSISIPASVTTIGSNSFFDTPALTEFIFLGSAPTVVANSFTGVASSATAYINSGATGFTTSGSPARWNGLAVTSGFYEASFDTKGGSTVPATYFGAIVNEPAVPTRDCSTFAGWSATDGGLVIPSFPYTPGATSNITLYAKWNLTTTCAGTPGATPNSKVVSIPVGVTEANIPANDALPAIKLNLAGATGQAVVTVAPISNPDAVNSPFTAGVSAKIVDINVTGITGNVTVCLDGGAGDSLFHFTGGAWVALPERSYVNGQVCGVTSSFSPFTAAIPSKTPAEIAAEAAAAAAAAERARLEAAAAEQARIAAAELASRTISAKQKYSLRSLANQTGIKIVSPKAKVTTTVAGSSKKVCTKSGSTLKTLVAGNCVVTYTVQEPKQTIKSFKSFVVGEVGSGSALNAKTSYSMNAIASANGISASAKGKLSMTVAKSSKGICSKSGSNLKMLKPGTCNVTFTVQEPQPAATKTTKTFVVK